MRIGDLCARCGIRVNETAPKGKCLHKNFAANVDVNRIQNDDGCVTRFNADIRVKCEDCGCEFVFLGLAPGLDLDGACVSVDAVTARLAIAPKGETLPPLEGPQGFAIRKASA